MCISTYCLLLAIVTCASGILTNGSNSINEEKFDINTEVDEDEVLTTTEGNIQVDNTSLLGNTSSSLLLRFSTPCETPNLEPALCIEIKKCPVLYKQLNNTKAWNFLRDSQCGPDNEDKANPKVCCGTYGNYRNITNKEDELIEDNQVFPKVCGAQKILIRGRIMGGSEAALGEFPWMARLIHKNKQGYKSFGCAGFLIHSKYVLTAAHCVKNKNIPIRGPLFSVVLGEHNTETKIDCSQRGTFCADPLQISRIAKVIVHPEYDPESKAHYNDVALIHLNKGARITDYVKPICLLTDPNDKAYKYSISGWGKTETEDFSKVKLKVDLRPFDNVKCKSKYSLLSIELRNTQLCVGGEKGKDSCSGDSGGPLMMNNGSIWYAAGIVSYGLGCGYEGWPGVYTNIPFYMSWIKNQMILNSVVNAKSNKAKKHKKKSATNNTKSNQGTRR